MGQVPYTLKQNACVTGGEENSSPTSSVREQGGYGLKGWSLAAGDDGVTGELVKPASRSSTLPPFLPLNSTPSQISNKTYKTIALNPKP